MTCNSYLYLEAFKKNFNPCCEIPLEEFYICTKKIEILLLKSGLMGAAFVCFAGSFSDDNGSDGDNGYDVVNDDDGDNDDDDDIDSTNKKNGTDNITNYVNDNYDSNGHGYSKTAYDKDDIDKNQNWHKNVDNNNNNSNDDQYICDKNHENNN